MVSDPGLTGSQSRQGHLLWCSCCPATQSSTPQGGQVGSSREAPGTLRLASSWPQAPGRPRARSRPSLCRRTAEDTGAPGSLSVFRGSSWSGVVLESQDCWSGGWMQQAHGIHT